MQCNCGRYIKKTSDYTFQPGSVHPRHPDNDSTLINCNRCGCPSDTHEIEEGQHYKELGNDEYALGHWDLAISNYSKAIASRPSDAVLYSNRAAAYLAKGWPDQALLDAQRALSLRPDWSKAHGRKAAALHQLARYPEAIQSWNSGLQIDPKNEALLNGLKHSQRSVSSKLKKSNSKGCVTTLPRSKVVAAADNSVEHLLGLIVAQHASVRNEMQKLEDLMAKILSQFAENQPSLEERTSRVHTPQEEDDASSAGRTDCDDESPKSFLECDLHLHSPLVAPLKERFKKTKAISKQSGLSLEALKSLVSAPENCTAATTGTLREGIAEENGWDPIPELQRQHSDKLSNDQQNSRQSHQSDTSDHHDEQNSKVFTDQRMDRVHAASLRQRVALESGDIIQESDCDVLSQARRTKCLKCVDECPGFKIVYRSIDANDPDVMFFCSNCGCASSDHEIDPCWYKEEEERQANAAKAQQLHHAGFVASFQLKKEESEALSVLGLTMGADEKSIRRAYKKLALKCHPDKMDSKAENFLTLTNAYNLLLNRFKV